MPAFLRVSVRFLLWGGVIAWWAGVAAGAAQPATRTMRSQSGQFIVQGAPLPPGLSLSASTSSVALLRLDPALVAVSCERIKQALLEELTMKDQWTGPIYLFLEAGREPNAPALLSSVRHSDGWNYHVNLPTQLDRQELIKATVQVLLLEITNRRAGRDPFELPAWLIEGFPVYLQASVLSTLTLEPDSRIQRRERNVDTLREVRAHLRAEAPLQFGDLSWPKEAQLAGENVVHYQSCAHLFVHELLRLKRGRECLRDMLGFLPESLNWQTAFLRAFSPHFERLVDVDKWWSLTLTHFTGRDPMSAWPREEAWSQLDQILTTPLQVRLQADEMPLRTQVTLQQILSEWDYSRQRPILAQKLNHLQAFSMRVPPEVSEVWDGYRQALELYTQKRARGSSASGPKSQFSPSHRVLVIDIVRRLDELDFRRELLRRPSPLTTTNAVPAPAPAGP